MLLAQIYHNEFPNGPVLHLNDASLERGGLFDIYQTWAPSHHEHRRGTVIDIRANDEPNAIPFKNFTVFSGLASRLGSNCRIHSSGTNRHFHCRPRGVAE